MEQNEKIKEMVREKYAEIAVSAPVGGCCGTSAKVVDYTIMADKYDDKEGYVADADLGLGCGVPVDYAEMKKGDIVLDLGSGAGNDVFVARAVVGAEGKVIGVDMTPEMIEKANNNNQKLGYSNVEFRLGEIEKLPVETDSVDVVISNCVLNLVPDKEKAFAEMYRVIKPGGHFSVSDIVLKGNLPEELKQSAEMYAGCVAGAQQEDEYLGGIGKAGFTDITIKKRKEIKLPGSILRQYMSEEQLHEYRNSETGIYSITVNGKK